MLNHASVRQYNIVSQIIKSYYNKINFSKQVKEQGFTIVHYFARDYALIKSSDPIIINDSEKQKNLKQFLGNLPFFVAIVLGLPNRKQFIDIQDKDGNTALIIAQKNNNYDFIDILLSYGANIDICNNSGLQVQCFTDTESATQKKMRFCGEEKCKKDYASSEFQSIDLPFSDKGIQAYSPHQRFIEQIQKDDYTITASDGNTFKSSAMKPSITESTEAKLERLSKEYKNANQFKNLDPFFSDRVAPNIDQETSDLLDELIKNQSQNTMSATSSFAPSQQNYLNKANSYPAAAPAPPMPVAPKTGSSEFVEYFINELRKYDGQAPAPAPAPAQPQQNAYSQNVLAGGNWSSKSKGKKEKVNGTRKMFEYKDNKKNKQYDFDFYGGKTSTDSSETGMRSLTRVTDQMIRDLEDKIIKKIKEVMKITDDELARDYRSGAWYLFKLSKGDALKEMKRLDRTIDFEKYINESILKKVDLKEAKKRRLENRERQEQIRSQKSSEKSSSSSLTPTSTTTASESTSQTKTTSEKKPREKKSDTKKEKDQPKRNPKVEISEYSLGMTDLSSMSFSDSSSYAISNKNIFPSTTSSFKSYTSSSRF
jgi:hypothetical protein